MTTASNFGGGGANALMGMAALFGNVRQQNAQLADRRDARDQNMLQFMMQRDAADRQMSMQNRQLSMQQNMADRQFAAQREESAFARLNQSLEMQMKFADREAAQRDRAFELTVLSKEHELRTRAQVTQVNQLERRDRVLSALEKLSEWRTSVETVMRQAGRDPSKRREAEVLIEERLADPELALAAMDSPQAMEFKLYAEKLLDFSSQIYRTMDPLSGEGMNGSDVKATLAGFQWDATPSPRQLQALSYAVGGVKATGDTTEEIVAKLIRYYELPLPAGSDSDKVIAGWGKLVSTVENLPGELKGPQLETFMRTNMRLAAEQAQLEASPNYDPRDPVSRYIVQAHETDVLNAYMAAQGVPNPIAARLLEGKQVNLEAWSNKGIDSIVSRMRGSSSGVDVPGFDWFGATTHGRSIFQSATPERKAQVAELMKAAIAPKIQALKEARDAMFATEDISFIPFLETAAREVTEELSRFSNGAVSPVLGLDQLVPPSLVAQFTLRKTALERFRGESFAGKTLAQQAELLMSMPRHEALRLFRAANGVGGMQQMLAPGAAQSAAGPGAGGFSLLQAPLD